MGRTPAAEGTTDYRNRGRVSKLQRESGDAKVARPLTKSERKAAIKAAKGRPKGAPKPVKPDRKPPQPHRMGEVTWKNERRKLDALFAIYIMGWETKKNHYTDWRYFIKPVDDGKRWESDMLPYFHDDTRSCYQGIEILRREGLYLTVETMPEGYEVVEKTKGLSVRDKDLNFAIMAVCLLLRGVSNKDIQHAWDNQDDWSKKAAKRWEKANAPAEDGW